MKAKLFMFIINVILFGIIFYFLNEESIKVEVSLTYYIVTSISFGVVSTVSYYIVRKYIN